MFGNRLIAVDVGISLIDQAVRETRERISQGTGPVSVVFPNRRSIRFYLHQLGAADALHVQTCSMNELAADLVFRFADSVPVQVSDLDRSFSLMEALRGGFAAMYARLGGEPDRVFPWCLRLIHLMDELDVNLVEDVSALSYVDEVVPEARELLGTLDKLTGLYRDMMKDRNWTGGGDLYRRAYELREHLQTPLLMVGFSGMTRSESGLFQYAWSRKPMSILFQTDLHGRHQAFQPFRVYDRWMDGRQWGRKPDKLVRSDPVSFPRIQIDEAFDLHSELERLHIHLSEDGDRLAATPTTAAVVIPDGGSLLPTIQVVPQKKLNVTAGYPFVRTGFYRLLDACMSIASHGAGERGFSVEGLTDLLGHPLLRYLLQAESEAENESRRAIEVLLSNGMAYLHLEALEDLLEAADLNRTRSFVARTLRQIIGVRSLSGMGTVIEELAGDVLSVLPDEPGVKTERELIHRFVETLQTELATSRFRDSGFKSGEVLFEIVRHLARQVHVRFEGNPLEGLQLMGFLESRLLQFPYLFVLDVNEGVLPSVERVDPLLPDSLRPLLQLPSSAEREAIETYHFFRLVDAAKDVVLLYRKGETAEQRNIRSRYIEQILVEDAARKRDGSGRIDVSRLEQEQVHTVTIHLKGMADQQPVPQLTGTDTQRLEHILENGISPSFLDSLIRCPYRVFLSRFRRVPEEIKLAEGQDPRQVGELVHLALESGMKAVKGATLSRSLIDRQEKVVKRELEHLMDAQLKSLSPVRLALLRKLADYRLATFFNTLRDDVKEEEVRILSVEEEVRVQSENQLLTGRMDRIDLRTNRESGKVRYLVLDYKTGSWARTPNSRMRASDWEELIDHVRGLPISEGLTRLRGSLHSIQLPFYAYLLSRDRGVDFDQISAALFLLGSGKEERFDGWKMGETGFLEILRYLIGLLRPGLEMEAIDDKDCGFCPYVRICRYTSHQSEAGS